MSGSETRAYPVSAPDVGERLDRFLAVASGLSRTRIAGLIEAGHVTVNGRPARPALRLAAGASVEVTMETLQTLQPPDPKLPANDFKELDIRWIDQDLLVVNKPRGLVVHPAAGHPTGTLTDFLEAWALERGETLPGRGGLVHRLDRDTTGLIVIARTEAAQTALTEALRRREIHRRYLALVHGHPRALRTVVEGALDRDPRDRTRMAVRAGGRQAVTHFTVLERFAHHTLLAVDLETGRTHQIRVHLSAVGLPIVGDPVYGTEPGRGQLLHAARLSFAHPRTGQPVTVEAPLPEDFASALAVLRESDHGRELPVPAVRS